MVWWTAIDCWRRAGAQLQLRAVLCRVPLLAAEVDDLEPILSATIPEPLTGAIVGCRKENSSFPPATPANAGYPGVPAGAAVLQNRFLANPNLRIARQVLAAAKAGV